MDLPTSYFNWLGFHREITISLVFSLQNEVLLSWWWGGEKGTFVNCKSNSKGEMLEISVAHQARSHTRGSLTCSELRQVPSRSFNSQKRCQPREPKGGLLVIHWVPSSSPTQACATPAHPPRRSRDWLVTQHCWHSATCSLMARWTRQHGPKNHLDTKNPTSYVTLHFNSLFQIRNKLTHLNNLKMAACSLQPGCFNLASSLPAPSPWKPEHHHYQNNRVALKQRLVWAHAAPFPRCMWNMGYIPCFLSALVPPWPKKGLEWCYSRGPETGHQLHPQLPEQGLQPGTRAWPGLGGPQSSPPLLKWPHWLCWKDTEGKTNRKSKQPELKPLAAHISSCILPVQQ